MSGPLNSPSDSLRFETVRVRGIVQGVGYRPTVWRLARELGIRGRVWNDAEGVSIEAWGTPEALNAFAAALRTDAPPLARVDAVERTAERSDGPIPDEFEIIASRGGKVQTDVSPDAATCPACLSEVLDPADRRQGYAFTNCTHCGPRLSIIRAIPYDRANTSMAAFPMCPACEAEYTDPADRRFHAQPNACPICGPRLWLEDVNGTPLCVPGENAIDAARARLLQGEIVAIKGLGGIHLACDACNVEAVNTLRARKQRYHKAFALMARDVDVVARFARVDDKRQALLAHSAAPIVVLDAQGEAVAPGVAPGQSTLGFMLPYTPLHHLLMQSMDGPIVLTSGNRSDEPQVIDNADARQRLGHIADSFLLHDRDIVNRLDDSVVRVSAGRSRMLRRARGYAPAPIVLAEGFGDAPAVLAMGAELKNTFCMGRGRKAVVSQHMGDLENGLVLADYRHNLELYRQLFDYQPEQLAIDMHPNYLSTQVGREMAQALGLPIHEVQHHHAHIAACLAEYGYGPDAAPVLGVALDGLGFGDDGTLWGGEFLLADYRGYQRLDHLPAVPMIGGVQAIRQPWRNAYAHLTSSIGWDEVRARYADLPIVEFLGGQNLSVLDQMMARGMNSPLASSCGRLFDAVAAAVGVCAGEVSFEGQAAMELESLSAEQFDREKAKAYVIGTSGDGFDMKPLWTAILQDLAAGLSAGVIGARFHSGLAIALVEKAVNLCGGHGVDTVVLSGGVVQNRLLLEALYGRLERAGLKVLAPERLPANDGGVSLGQAAVAASRTLGD